MATPSGVSVESSIAVNRRSIAGSCRSSGLAVEHLRREHEAKLAAWRPWIALPPAVRLHRVHGLRLQGAVPRSERTHRRVAVGQHDAFRQSPCDESTEAVATAELEDDTVGRVAKASEENAGDKRGGGPQDGARAVAVRCLIEQDETIRGHQAARQQWHRIGPD